jgi:inosine-uridine nucleoside N-ribohydrolase
VDDDLALLVLLAAAAGCRPAESKVNILGVTTVAGNALQRHTFADALHISQRVNRSLPVLQGAAWWPPFATSWRPRGPSAASRFIVQTVLKEAPNSVTLLALGPLTNVAAALASEPQLAGRLKRIVIMGGDLDPDHLDLNMLSDLEAAYQVLCANVAKLLVPVQTCTQAVFGSQHLEAAVNACASAPRERRSHPHVHDTESPVGCTPALLAKMRRQLWMMPKFINPRLKQVQLS